MTLTERRRETARFTAFVNDPLARAYPNERLAIRVAEKNLALAEELSALCLQLMMAYRSAMRCYAGSGSDIDHSRFMFDAEYMGRAIMMRVTKRGHDALAKVLGPHPLFSAPERRADGQSTTEGGLTPAQATVTAEGTAETSSSVEAK